MDKFRLVFYQMVEEGFYWDQGLYNCLGDCVSI